MLRGIVVGGLWLAGGIAGGVGGAAAQELPDDIAAIFDQHCTACHRPGPGEEKAQAAIPDILNLSDIIARGKIRPGDPENSSVYTQVRSNDMPDGAKFFSRKPVSDDDKERLRAWIASLTEATSERAFISDGDVLGYIFNDIAQVPAERARRYRYFTLTHLHNNAGVSDDELETYRQGLSKLVNSLTWNRVIERPYPVDPAATVFRVDIDRLGWSEELWDRVAGQNPYAKFYESVVSETLGNVLRVTQPAIRADWFAAKVSVPPLYNEFAQIPETQQELERRLLFGGLTADEAVIERPYEVLRAGVQKSGVSSQNRMVERQGSFFGAYWRSFDFKAEDLADPEDRNARRNFFRFPVGPGGENGFLHDGGEIIFNLPNGAQAYMLTLADGTRLDDAAPTEIVFDRNAAGVGRDPAIRNGLSCIACHAAGMKPVRDEVLAHVQRSVFPIEVRLTVEDLHRDEAFQQAIEEDEDRFIEAMKRAGVTKFEVSGEPVSAMVARFEDVNVDARAAAAELGFTEEQFLAEIDRLDGDRTLAGIRAQLEGAGVPRGEFIAVFDRLRAAFGIDATPTVPAVKRTENQLDDVAQQLARSEDDVARITGALRSLRAELMCNSDLADRLVVGDLYAIPAELIPHSRSGWVAEGDLSYGRLDEVDSFNPDDGRWCSLGPPDISYGRISVPCDAILIPEQAMCDRIDAIAGLDD